MPDIETERLRLHALTPSELTLLLYDMDTLEKKLSCTYRAELIEGGFEEVIRGQLDKCEEDCANWLYNTFWLMIRKSDGVAVGSFDYKNPPDEHGEVEIGYGISPEFEHNGYMTESILALCAYTEEQGEVRALTAETERNNVASQNVLKRCGFMMKRETEHLLFFRREMKPRA